MRVPLGVVGIIYESRPNVTIDAAALCLKSGNAAVLRGGSEAIRSNQALAKCIQAGLAQVALPAQAPSGRSCASRMFRAGKLRMEDSSVMVPLSERTARECICR